ncbi:MULTISPECIES: YCF48-related protein [unclassified Duganella]|uniref:YCF48-related protein n=1 Tax=unclassified Duganella TaxID=2636909 RepID=UPI001587417F|nr:MULTISPECIES: YCF48-related protein [unclassified Duganella]
MTIAFCLLTACGGGSGSTTPTPPPAPQPLQVQITAASQNELSAPVQFAPTVSNGAGQSLQYAWNFGDGQTSTSERPEHRYTAGGNYQVTLTVSNTTGSASSTLPIQVGYFAGVAGQDCTGAKPGQGWCRQSPQPTAKDFISIKMTTNKVIWALANQNTVVRSTDGGASWFSKRVPTSAKLSAITAIDANTAWVVGSNGFESHTKDGGTTWVRGNMPANTPDLMAIGAIRDGSTLWATGSSSAVLKSTDGGASWTGQSLDTDANCTLWSVSAVDAGNAWLAGPDCIARTTNGGAHWTRSDGFNVRSISAVDANTAWVAKLASIEKTTDGGKTWVSQVSRTLNGTGIGAQYTSIAAVDLNTVFAADFSGFIIKTTDGGNSWKDQSPPEAFTCCQNPHFSVLSAFDASSAVVGGREGVIYASTDGQSWASKNRSIFSPANTDIRSIAVFDANHAVVPIGGYGMVHYTENGGVDWQRQASPRALDCAHAITRLNATTALGLGCGTLLKSTDQGKNWQSTFIGSGQLNALSVVNENTYWAAGEYGTITRTSDGGATWTAAAGTLPRITFRDIYAVDEQNVWAVGDYETLVHTTDGGKTWAIKTANTILNGYSAVIALNANTAWVTHSSQSLMVTNDAGATWSKVNTGVDDLLLTLATLDGKVLWAAGVNGRIVRSEDSGKTWSVQDSGTNDYLFAIRLIDNNTAWVTGANGTILKTATAGK